jgi:2,3-bisphosphoglycerate-dependent phosphoglycerate mutase
MTTTYTLVLIRHGQSTWNLENRFTGWTDVGLTELGRQEALAGGKALRENGYQFDIAYTSVLKRAIKTLWIVLEELEQEWLPVHRAWQLNERHYGALQGLNKAETAERLGKRLVIGWRRAYLARPPALEWDDHRHPRFDSLYAGLPAAQLPRSESLHDTVQRMLPYWQTEIVSAIRSGQRTLIVAHGNSLRSLLKYLENTPEAEVPAINIPTGVPRIYELDVDLRPVNRYDLDTEGDAP